EREVREAGHEVGHVQRRARARVVVAEVVLEQPRRAGPEAAVEGAALAQAGVQLGVRDAGRVGGHGEEAEVDRHGPESRPLIRYGQDAPVTWHHHHVTLGPVATIPAYELVLEQLRRSIQLGHFLPGDKLPPERDLARQLGVSRTTVREAVRVLEGEGAVEIRRGSAGGIVLL